MILSAKETTVQSVGVPEMRREACFVDAGKGDSRTFIVVMMMRGELRLCL